MSVPELDEHPTAAVSPEPRPAVALSAAQATAQKLLGGPERRRRWKAFFVLAAMAGLVGAGAAPPPLGLLLPVWNDPTLHEAVFGSPAVVAWLVFLGVFLIGMGGFARSFTLAFFEGIVTGAPATGGYRQWLRPGVAHFAWSAACTLPLYALLFLGEALITHQTVAEITRVSSIPESTEAELMSLFVTAGLKFFLVLLPWVLVTLPAMVAVYELTPAGMVLWQTGPAAAFGRVFRQWKRRPLRFAGYFGFRYLLQFAGNSLALVALIPCLLVTAPVTAPLVAGGWAAAGHLGGTSTGAGAAVATVSCLVAAVVLYCALCVALLPFTVVLNAFALRWLELLPVEERIASGPLRGE
jgi:hypothetical protein